MPYEEDIEKLINQVYECLDDAAEHDNTLDQTLYYSGRATTMAVLAAMMQLSARLSNIQKQLAEIRQKLD